MKRTILVTLILCTAVFGLRAELTIVAEGGNTPYSVIAPDGSVVSSHQREDKAIERASNESAANGGASYRVRKTGDLIVTNTPDEPVVVVPPEGTVPVLVGDDLANAMTLVKAGDTLALQRGGDWTIVQMKLDGVSVVAFGDGPRPIVRATGTSPVIAVEGVGVTIKGVDFVGLAMIGYPIKVLKSGHGGVEAELRDVRIHGALRLAHTANVLVSAVRCYGPLMLVPTGVGINNVIVEGSTFTSIGVSWGEHPYAIAKSTIRNCVFYPDHESMPAMHAHPDTRYLNGDWPYLAFENNRWRSGTVYILDQDERSFEYFSTEMNAPTDTDDAERPSLWPALPDTL